MSEVLVDGRRIAIPKGWRLRIMLEPIPETPIAEQPLELGADAPTRALEPTRPPTPPVARARSGATGTKRVHGKLCPNQRCNLRVGPRTNVCMCGFDFRIGSMG